MSPTLGERLAEARRQAFVGREGELHLFRQLLSAAEPATCVLYVHGPAGVGKTTLLRRFTDVCREQQVPYVALDARDVPPTPEAVAAQMHRLLGSDHDSAAARTVVLVDTFELLAGIEGWVRQDLLPQLPADALVVLAGQYPPGPDWRADPGWSEVVRAVPLGNLSPQDSAGYLARRQIPPELHHTAVSFTRGHPLALALVGEVLKAQKRFSPKDAPQVIKTLVDQLVTHAPSPLHRGALEACAQVRVVTEDLLATLLDVPDAAEVFAWMRGLPFMDAGVSGIYPHDLARDVLAADLQWRHPRRFAELHARARQHYLARMEESGGTAQVALLLDLTFLHAELRPFLLPPSPSDDLQVAAAGPQDHEAVRSIVAKHEGEDSARLADYWLQRQPQAWQTVRATPGGIVGVLCLVAMAEATDGDRAVDPAVAAAARELGSHPPLRPGERATLCRFWMAADTYQDFSPVQSLIALQLGRHYLRTPALALSLLAFAEPERWVEFCGYTEQVRLPGADFAVGDRTYGVYGHDWRVMTPASWLTQLSRREIGEPARDPVRPPAQDLLVLAEEEFAVAVRRALRDLGRPERLRGNPLLESRFVRARTGLDASLRVRVGALQQVVREASDTLRGSPADERLYRVLNRAYLAPAPSLERAAELLDLPSSTFRRHLGRAVQRVVAILWEQELGA